MKILCKYDSFWFIEFEKILMNYEWMNIFLLI